MPSLKEIRTKISSVKSTKRIMQAMKMIATVKYAKTQLMLNSFRPYFKSYEDIVKIVTGSIKDSSSRFLNPNENSDKDILIIVSSDRGLCGSYNTSLFRMIEKHNFKSENIKNLYVGKKGADYFKEIGFGESISSLTEKNYKNIAEEITDQLLIPFLEEKIDNIYIAYNKFESAISQAPTISKVLPIQLEVDKSEDDKSGDILIEPGIESFVEEVLPKFFNLTISSVLLESVTSEHAARTAAMDNATRNADDILRDTTILFNKTRQAYITTELMDIVNGAEAIK
ncbi:ATP synthase F1 subunit gamma [Desulfobacterota bacterium]|nr:ATP synthase F1 subunit gamma [Thermodesulfobacteriota bacterium]|tara:strand:+ start:28958 stop:29809 length:852 start_codon:yes stop_codon:yes gene_type:complete